MQATRDTPLPDPMAPGQFQLGPDGQPVTVPVPIYQEIFWEHLSPKMILIPASFNDTEYDKAPWLGWRFRLPLEVGKRMFHLPTDFESTSSRGDALKDRLDTTSYSDPAEWAPKMLTGVWLEYKASLYDSQEPHPLKIRELCFIDGVEEPVIHRDSPHQTFGQDGKITANSLVGFTTHLFTTRNMTDSAYVPSDCTIMRPLVNELTLFRTQVINHRDASTSIRIANGGVLTNEILSKVIRGPYGSIIPLPEASYDPARPPVMEVAHPQYSRENFEGARVIENDLVKVSALGQNQVASRQEAGTSATEATYIQRSTDTRMNAERNRLMRQFIAAVRKIDILLQRYPETQMQPLQLGRYAYSIKPDSGQHIDVAEKRKFALDRYNFFAKAPNVNQQYLMEETAPLLDLDPARLFTPPPPPHPPMPKTSVIVKGDDINPLAPQYANMVEMLKILGFALTPQPLTPQLVGNAALAEPLKQKRHTPPPATHDGVAPQADRLNQHQADETGQRPGPGPMTPMGGRPS